MTLQNTIMYCDCNTARTPRNISPWYSIIVVNSIILKLNIFIIKAVCLGTDIKVMV